MDGMAIAMVMLGTLLAYGGLTGKSPLQTTQAIIQGKSPGKVTQDKPITGQSNPNTSAAPDYSTANQGAAPHDVQGYQAYAFSLFPSYGWGSDQQAPLIQLWNKESSWDPTAENGSSGAYGIPQSLPGSKMATAGADWQTNPETQIRWGLGYISQTYGSPAAAWQHEISKGWYLCSG